MTPRSREIGSLNHDIALKFDRRLHSGDAETSVKFHSDQKIVNANLAA